MKLTVIVPAYNESATIEKVLTRLVTVKPEQKEIIVVDDGSTDGTRQILNKLADSISNLKVVFHEKNRGKGGAIKTGLSYMTGDAVVIQDADLEYDPAELIKLLKPIEENRARVVYGSRLLEKSNSKGSIAFYIGRYSISYVVNLLFGTHITDAYTCYKMFKKSVIKNIDITSNGFELEAELTAKTILMGEKIMEVPIKYYPRTINEGKKINWRDWFKGVKALIKYRFGEYGKKEEKK